MTSSSKLYLTAYEVGKYCGDKDNGADCLKIITWKYEIDRSFSTSNVPVRMAVKEYPAKGPTPATTEVLTCTNEAVGSTNRPVYFDFFSYNSST